MKAFFFTLILKISSLLPVLALTLAPDSLAPCMSFVEKHRLPAIDYTLHLFDRYSIVMFCQRKHNELTQYESLTDLFIKIL